MFANERELGGRYLLHCGIDELPPEAGIRTRNFPFSTPLHLANVGILIGLMLVFAQLQQTNTITGAELFSDNLESVVMRELSCLVLSNSK